MLPITGYENDVIKVAHRVNTVNEEVWSAWNWWFIDVIKCKSFLFTMQLQCYCIITSLLRIDRNLKCWRCFFVFLHSHQVLSPSNLTGLSSNGQNILLMLIMGSISSEASVIILECTVYPCDQFHCTLPSLVVQLQLTQYTYPTSFLMINIF